MHLSRFNTMPICARIFMVSPSFQCNRSHLLAIRLGDGMGHVSFAASGFVEKRATAFLTARSSTSGPNSGAPHAQPAMASETGGFSRCNRGWARFDRRSWPHRLGDRRVQPVHLRQLAHDDELVAVGADRAVVVERVG